METNRSNPAANNDIFEVKESRNKFVLFGLGTIVVALFLFVYIKIYVTLISIIATILLTIGLLMVYKGIRAKTLITIDHTGIWSVKHGLIPWEKIETFSSEIIANSNVVYVHCQPPMDVIIVDLSMCNITKWSTVKSAIEKYSPTQSILLKEIQPQI
jgi:hypothetical protein